MPAKAGIQTWPHMLRPWIPAFPGITVKKSPFPSPRKGCLGRGKGNIPSF
jgi:hypothetical protein